MLREWGAVLAMTVLVAGCAGTIQRADEYAAEGDWSKAVMEYRKAHAKRPHNVEYKSRLKQTELQAAEFFYHQGMGRVARGDLDGAIVQYQQGLSAMPEHGKLQQAMADVLARKEAQVQYGEGRLLAEAGKKSEAAARFRQALEIYPRHQEAASALDQLNKDLQAGEAAEGVVLRSRAPITLNFRQSDPRQAFEFLGKSFGVNVIFDEAVRNVPVTLFAQDVSFDQGLSLLLSVSGAFYKKVGPNTILIAPDNKEKRGQYEDHVVRTFQLSSVKAKEMADILKGLMVIKKIIVNDTLNSIAVRDTPEIVKLAARIIENNDRKPAELVLDVEILEVNRTKAEKLGIDLGSYQIAAAVPTFTVGTPFRDALDATTVTLPSATLRFYKQDVDAKTLANPKVRVIHGKSAKIHIGDRVPLRAAIIQDATGQVRTTFDYREIGIRLTVEPDIHVDNTTTVKLALEVSSLGENLGTANEPAYRIGTRNAETVMLLRDGETAILGGLIRDEERNTRLRLPGIGAIPAIGSLFTSYDDSGGRTDVLLTITPRVVRGWDAPAQRSWEFYSGTENVYTTRPAFAEVDGAARVRTMAEVPAEPTESVSAAHAPAPAPASPEAGATAPVLGFSAAGYEVARGEELAVALVGSRLAGVSRVDANILYNAQVLGFVRGEHGDAPARSVDVQAGAAPGTLGVAVGFDAAPADDAAFARLVMMGSQPGVSYLVYQAPAVKGSNGEVIDAQLRASRIVVR